MHVKQFNIRVYGILINEKEHVLVTDELIKGVYMTKFPGGGLEFGEGMVDCIKREFLEETNTAIDVIEHFYTTDFFQQSAFNKEHQIISVYYLVKAISNLNVPVREKIVDFTRKTDTEQQFRWLSLKNISEKDFTLPIDKVIGNMLANRAENKKNKVE